MMFFYCYAGVDGVLSKAGEVLNKHKERKL